MKRVLRGLLGLGGLAVLLCVLAFAWLVWQVDHVGRQDEARPANVIVVLGARVEPDGKPGPDLASRTQHAVSLWRAGYASDIICSGGYKNERLSAAAVCRRSAIQLGVPADQLWLADGSQNTVEDARSSAAVMAEHGWRTAILVSHPLHLYRAAWLFRRAGVDVVTSPTSTQTDLIDFPWRVWLAMREAGAVVMTGLGARGWLPPNWTARLQALAYNLP